MSPTTRTRTLALAGLLFAPSAAAQTPAPLALTGGTVSEPVNELLWVVGREMSLRRLEAEAGARAA